MLFIKFSIPVGPLLLAFVVAFLGVLAASQPGFAGQNPASAACAETQVSSSIAGSGETLSADEQELARRVNDYRAALGLPRIPISRSLSRVAQYHSGDLSRSFDVKNDRGCNLHSWSSDGPWKTSCCYTPDHAQARCMWEKPREIGGYRGNGYEIAAWGVPALTPQQLLELWKSSPGHHAMIINGKFGKTDWSDAHWQAMGVGIRGNFATVWFGEEPDLN